MHGRRLRATGIILAGVIALSGCSGDNGDDTETPAAADADVAVTTTEYQFTPATWTASAGEFSVALTNDGTVEHEWAVVKQGEDIASEDEFTEDKVLLEIEAVPAGESTTEDVTIDEPGTYQVICALPGHFNEGMEGTLTVE